jgi:hypothetical protein
MRWSGIKEIGKLNFHNLIGYSA